MTNRERMISVDKIPGYNTNLNRTEDLIGNRE